MNAKRIASYVALALVVLVVYALIRRPPVVLLAILAAAAVAYWISRDRDRGHDPETATPASKEPAQPEWIDHLRELVKLNVLIREHDFPAAVIARLEHIVDVLRRLLPELNQSYVGAELTWTVNRMATDYLMRVVRPYVALSPAARRESEGEFLASLAGLESELETIERMVHERKQGDFETKAAFLRARFLDSKI